jgi:hypothetical protein
MKVSWQNSALADIRSCMPQGFRRPLRDKLQGLIFPGQGLPCNDPRYPGARIYKFHHWLAMYHTVSANHIIVIGVEYNYG